MPTRRIFELVVVTGLAMKPAFGLVKLWTTKAFMTAQPGTVTHGAAEVLAVVLS